MQSLPQQLSDVTVDAQAVEAWERCLTHIGERVQKLAFRTWFEPIKPLRLDGNHLVVRIPSQFFYDWIEEHYHDILRSAITSALGTDARLSYSIVADDSLEKLPPPAHPAEPERLPEPQQQTTQNESIQNPFMPRFIVRLTGNGNALPRDLNPRYRFDNFVNGESNQLARAAALAVANNPGGTNFNPLLIYAGSGLGKTHLIHALGNHAYYSEKAKRVVYVTSEKFTTEFVNAIQNDKLMEFQHFYRTVDLLIVDDIQFFSGKAKTLDSFFHTFNTLYQLGKQIVLTSDVPPKDLTGVDERLITRFQSGLTVDIQPPDLETRIAILQKKCEEQNVRLTQETINYVASAVTRNIRELEGCLVRIIAHSSLSHKPITLDLVKEIVRTVVKDVSTPVTIDQIQRAVCAYYDIDEAQIRGKTRQKEVVLARQISMYLAKELTNYSLKTIGLHFGGRDHSTVIHAYQTIEDGLKSDEALKRAVDDLRRKVVPVV